MFHGVTIPPEMARQAVVLSERYITDRFLPDKAIDLLDEACSDLNQMCIRDSSEVNCVPAARSACSSGFSGCSPGVRKATRCV